MSGIDKIISAITPPESDEQRAEARASARAAASPGDWLSLVLDHHAKIERAFEAVRAAPDAASRRSAQKALAVVLTGHSIAEEAVLYPALAHAGHKGQAGAAYAEQTAAKMQIAALERLDPLSEDYLDKLGHLEGAVRHHVYSEESSWFLELKREAPADEQDKIGQRYAEEYNRYVSGGEAAPVGERAPLEPRSFGSASL
jgi:hypothetical protein